MDITTFFVNKDGKQMQYPLQLNNTINDFKEMIKKDYAIKDYIDLNFILEKPMRTLGKFNLEPGILPRTLDRYKLDSFGIKDKNISLTFDIIEDYVPQLIKKKNIDLKKYRNIENQGSEYDLTSEQDFPKLS